MLPLELNKLLIIVVVLSMALTPLLNEIGRKAAELIDNKVSVIEVCTNFFACEQNMYYKIRLFDCHYLNQLIGFF